jgi:hypothetical protein
MSAKRPVTVRADDQSAADWLYEWSYEELRPCDEDLAASVTNPTVVLRVTETNRAKRRERWKYRP